VAVGRGRSEARDVFVGARTGGAVRKDCDDQSGQAGRVERLTRGCGMTHAAGAYRWGRVALGTVSNRSAAKGQLNSSGASRADRWAALEPRMHAPRRLLL